MAPLHPRFGEDPVIVLDGDPAAILEPTVRQRRRLARLVAAFDDDQWEHPSRCEGWSNRDVISHLDSTNGFWTASIIEGAAGRPTRFLVGFDPVAGPAQLVEATSAMTTSEVHERFVSSTDALIAALQSLDAPAWMSIAEAPAGHVTINALTHHALWDSWVHERDILFPLGIEPEHHDDEVAASLRFAAALGPALALGTNGELRTGSFAIHVTNPDLEAVVDIGECISVRARTDVKLDAGATSFTLRGDAVALLEGLSVRAPLDQPVPADAAWMLSGLVAAFDGRPA